MQLPRLHLHRPAHGTVVAYTALVLALSGTAYAASGGNFVLGETNKAGDVTSLRNTHGGTALKLSTSDGNQANLKVSNDTKIKKLNADKLDGHGTKFWVQKSERPINAVQTDPGAYTFSATSLADVPNVSVTFTIPEKKDREIVALYTAECSMTGNDGQYGNVQILLDGTAINPAAGDFSMCSPQYDADTLSGGYVGAAVQGVAEDINPGTHTIKVVAAVSSTPASLRLDNHALTVLALP